MERRELIRLQPHYIKQFFTQAFESLGGKLSKREKDVFQINHVPAVILRIASTTFQLSRECLSH